MRRKQHLHHRFPTITYDLAGLGIPMGVRFDNDDGDGDGDGHGGSGGGSGSGSGKAGGPQVNMTQAALDALIRDAKAQARRSEKTRIEETYGKLDDLKARAEANADAFEAFKAVAVTLGIEVKDDQSVKDVLKVADERMKALVQTEKDKAETDQLAVRQDALKKAGMNPDLAKVLNWSDFKGATAEDLAKELEPMKSVVGAMGKGGSGGQGTGGQEGQGAGDGQGGGNIGAGTNPTGTGQQAPSTLHDAIAAHYDNK